MINSDPPSARQPDDTAGLTARLTAFGEEITQWKADALDVRKNADAAVAGGDIDTETLTRLEQTTEKIYDAIARFEALKLEIAAQSPQAASQIAEVGEALRLILLEVTELGTRMYAASNLRAKDSSAAPPDAAPANPTPTSATDQL